MAEVYKDIFKDSTFVVIVSKGLPQVQAQEVGAHTRRVVREDPDLYRSFKKQYRDMAANALISATTQ